MHLAGRGTGEVCVRSHGCSLQGEARIKLSGDATSRKREVSTALQTGPAEGSGLSGVGVVWSIPPLRPVPAPAVHGACLGQMPAGSNRERPKLFGWCEDEPILFLCASLRLFSPPHAVVRSRPRKEKLPAGESRSVGRGLYLCLGSTTAAHTHPYSSRRVG